MKDKMPIWLSNDNQKAQIKKPNIEMIILELLSDNDDGIRLINEYWEGIKLATKLVETEAIIIKIKAKFVISKLSSFPIISFGLVNERNLQNLK